MWHGEPINGIIFHFGESEHQNSRWPPVAILKMLLKTNGPRNPCNTTFPIILLGKFSTSKYSFLNIKANTPGKVLYVCVWRTGGYPLIVLIK